MPNLLKLVSKPEYFFRPKQVLQRFRHLWRSPRAVETVELPWGAMVVVHMAENVGSDIFHYGIFDRIVPEAIWRLSDEGEMGVDIGANIGQNSSVMAIRSGVSGRVIAFEPHPITFGELRQNVANWSNLRMARIQLENVALGRENGEARLGVSGFLSGASLTAKGKGMSVLVRKLDEYLADVRWVGVCKIDVEGHELAVLQGAEAALKRHAIRDIIFEDFSPQPSPLIALFEGQGFKVFALHTTWLKPRLIPLERATQTSLPGFSFNYLATLDADRAVKRFQSMGWRCLLNF